jgi:RHS repeat-associated protein
MAVICLFGKIGSTQTMQNSTGQVYRYTGKPFDDDNGIDIYYYGARYYDPELGRFLSCDPLASKYPGWSPYVYTLDNPIKFIDPNGEDAWEFIKGGGTGAFNFVTGTLMGIHENIQAFNENPVDYIEDVGMNATAFVMADKEKMAQDMALQIADKWTSGDFGKGEIVGQVGASIALAFAGVKGPNIFGATNKIKTAQGLISKAGTLTRLKSGKLQGFVTGNADDIFGQLTKGAEKLESGVYKLKDGTIIHRHPSKSTGATTIDINKNGQIYKIRIEEK